MTTNRYDRTDMVRQTAAMRAGPLKIAAYQVRDPETDEFSTNQFHMTYDNTVMAVLDESSAKLFANFIQGFQVKLDQPLVVTDRVKELLEAGNDKLDQIRELKKLLRAYHGIADEMENILIQHGDATGYCGCDLELRHRRAAVNAKNLLDG